MAKGAAWERDMARRLSEYWSRKGDDDLFWRTDGSGARATARTKKGKKTRGQYGDIAANDSRGATLTKAFTISLKRGYSKNTFQDTLDALDHKAKDGSRPEQQYAGWIREAEQCAIDARAISWWLIVRRDKRKAVIILPGWVVMFALPMKIKKELKSIVPQASFVTWIRREAKLTAKQKDQIHKMWKAQGIKKKRRAKLMKKEIKRRNKESQMLLHVYPLEEFLDIVDRKTIVELVKNDEVYGQHKTKKDDKNVKPPKPKARRDRTSSLRKAKRNRRKK